MICACLFRIDRYGDWIGAPSLGPLFSIPNCAIFCAASRCMSSATTQIASSDRSSRFSSPPGEFAIAYAQPSF